MLRHLTHKKPKKVTEVVEEPEQPERPILSEEDQAFLQRIAEEGEPPPLPARPRPSSERPLNLPVVGEHEGNEAQLILYEAKDTPLPEAPDTPIVRTPIVLSEDEEDQRSSGKGEELKSPKKKAKWSFLRRDSRESKRKSQKAAATDLMSAAEGLKSPDAQPNEDGNVSDHEAQKEEQEMSDVLEQLNLAAVNNRVFSMSNESQELLRKFTLVFKDLVNGVPTAYQDLESLLTNSEDQIQKSYEHLPSFLQKLIKQLPAKMTQSVGPEVLAAAAEKQGLHSKYTDNAAHAAEKMGVKVRVPNLKDLVTKPGAVAGMLKAIMNFLKLRFPAFLGMNVLYSLGLFVLLFVFWYCHKRGREVRLEKERLLTEVEIEALNESSASADVPTTTAAPGVPMEQVEAGLHSPQGGESSSSYAPDGSLAKELARDGEPKPSEATHTITASQGT